MTVRLNYELSDSENKNWLYCGSWIHCSRLAPVNGARMHEIAEADVTCVLLTRVRRDKKKIFIPAFNSIFYEYHKHHFKILSAAWKLIPEVPHLDWSSFPPLDRDHRPSDFSTSTELSSSLLWLVHSWPRDRVSGPFHQQCCHHASVLSTPLSPLHLVVTASRTSGLLVEYSPERLAYLWGSPHCGITAIVSHRGITALNWIFCKVLGGCLTKVISACKILQQNKLI